MWADRPLNAVSRRREACRRRVRRPRYGERREGSNARHGPILERKGGRRRAMGVVSLCRRPWSEGTGADAIASGRRLRSALCCALRCRCQGEGNMRRQSAGAAGPSMLKLGLKRGHPVHIAVVAGGDELACQFVDLQLCERAGLMHGDLRLRAGRICAWHGSMQGKRQAGRPYVGPANRAIRRCLYPRGCHGWRVQAGCSAPGQRPARPPARRSRH